MTERLEKEVRLLRRHYPQVEALKSGQSVWLKIPGFPVPSDTWNKSSVTVCFEIQPGYPGTAPYGFYLEGGLRFKGTNAQPQQYQEPAETPYGGLWGKFSWSHDNSWRPTSDLVTGGNVLNFVQSFRDRLKQGA